MYVFAVSLFDRELLCVVKAVALAVVLALFWSWETIRPLRERREGRLLHASRNLGVAIVNTVVLALLFGAATVAVAKWAADNDYGFLRHVDLPAVATFVLAIVILDAWMYFWHRITHAVPLLWRFHRMHHSDDRMDVTTATRFHLGELATSATLRLGLIPLLGFDVTQVLVYDTLVLIITHFHHANISLGRWDRVLCWFIVTPAMHQVHHSRHRPETDSNFATVLSIWDRLARTFRRRRDPITIELGLDELSDPRWQTYRGLWATPFVNPQSTDHTDRDVQADLRTLRLCHTKGSTMPTPS